MASRLGLRLIDVERLERGEADVGPHLEAIAQQLGKPTAWFVGGAAMPGEVERLGAETERWEEVAAEERRDERVGALEERIGELRAERDDAIGRVRSAEWTAAEARRDVEERVAALEQRIDELRKEHDEALAQLRADEHRIEEFEKRAVAAERRAAELAARIGRTKASGTESRVRDVEAERAPLGATAASGQGATREEGVEAQVADTQDTGEEPHPITSTENPEAVNLNIATFEQLRELGMSITQSKRVIDYRERVGCYKTVDDLDAVPGFGMTFRAELKSKLAV